MIEHWPSAEDLATARLIYEKNEPRNLFYRIAIELTNLAIEKKTSISVAEALASLLQTWNRPYYQYRKFDAQHFLEIESLIKRTFPILIKIRNKEIACPRQEIEVLFSDFEEVLGPVGASKCLHLLAPNFFPLWDRAIANRYGLSLQKKGENATLYAQFLYHTQKQSERTGSSQLHGRSILKAIDEYNFCKFTKGWL